MKNIELSDLIIFKDFVDNETIQKAVSLFSNYNKENYIAVQREMTKIMDDAVIDRDYWKNFIVNILAEDENVFSLSAEKGKDIHDTRIMDLAKLELLTVKELYNIDFGELKQSMRGPDSDIAMTQNIAVDSPEKTNSKDKREEIVYALENKNHEESIEILYDYFKKYGSGLLERYCVFEWKEGLVGVSGYDHASFDDLFLYEQEKKKLMENTEFLLDGKKAANALLYGDSGTGKSSSVKALIEKYKDKGLKLISIAKEQIYELPKILDYTGNRGCKFIIFIDDLSFEENEVDYKQFKSVLEGSVKSEPANTVIYVTSNRRNIIREVWSEREGSDDVHLRDTLQEKKSLSDRFGLIITFSKPTKDEYLEIVKGLAEKKGLKINDDLYAEALKWDVRRGGRSGRTARYFIDYYSSKTR